MLYGCEQTLQSVKDYLLSIQHGVFEPDDYLKAWLPPAVCTYFLEHAVEIIPKAIRWGIGRPFECHRNALEYAAEHPGTTPYFGFQYALRLDGESWELHSFAMEPDETVIDSGTEAPQCVRYFAVEWSWELYDLIAKNGAA
jgi:hypothetical protein